LVPVLEGRMRVVEAMQRQSHGMFLELERQAFEHDQALAFYRARGNPEELVPVLEGRMRVVEAMQRQSHGMFLELERQAFE
ncbi:hypothetical protein CTI14_67945, partial [Methylobacterium radiotolerans]